METRSNLIERINAYLRATGKSPTALCNEAGVHHHVVSNIKNGKSVSLRSIEKIEATLAICQLTLEAAQ